MPVLNIKDPEVHALAVELAEHTGQTLTQAVKEALRDRLARERAAKSDRPPRFLAPGSGFPQPRADSWL